MNHHSRRVRSPPSGYDPRVMPNNRIEHDDPYHLANHFDESPHQSLPVGPPHPPPFMEHGPQHNFPMNYRDQHRLPSSYRETLSQREPYPIGGTPGSIPPPPPQQMQRASSPPYKILCITNINPKIGDASVKDALANDYCRFGDISVSICHDSGERLAYIYFRNYEEAREARHSKSRTLLFDRPVEIEPIYDPRANGSPPIDSSPPGALGPPMSAIYSPRRRSVTPPDYPYDINGPMGHRRQVPPYYNNYKHQPVQPSMHQQQARGLSPVDYRPQPTPPHPGAYPHVLSPPPIGPVMSPHDRRMGYGGGGYGPTPPHMSHPNSPPYSSSPHPESYRSSYPPHQPTGHPPNHANYPPGVPSGGGGGGGGSTLHSMHRERAYNESIHMNSRSSRGDPYYPADSRGYFHGPPLPGHQTSPRHLPNPSSGSNYHQLIDAHHHPGYRSAQPSMPAYNQYHHHHRSAPDPPVRYLSREYRREKFGADHLNSDADDSRPSRVLLVNNIDSSKTETDLRDTFGPFGIIEEMEVKKVAPDLSSALIKFSSMDGAYKAKTANNGRHIGNARCRIVYGKVSASRRLWIGGLSPATTILRLEDECGKFGDIVSMDYTSGRPYAYVEYESANQAQFAAHHLRTTLTPANERKIRIEFVDPERSEKMISGADSNSQISEPGSKSRTTNESLGTSELEPSPQSTSGRKRSLTPSEISSNKRSCHAYGIHLGANTFKQERLAAAAAAKARTSSTSSIASHPHHLEDSDKQNESIIEDNSRGEHAIGNGETTNSDGYHEDEPPSDEILARCTSVREIVQHCSVSWLCQLALRNFIFGSRIFLCSGRKQFVDKFLAKSNNSINENGSGHYPILRITQRWRLHPQPKLEEVKKRMQSGNLGIFIITTSGLDDDKAQRQPDLGNHNDQTASIKDNNNSEEKDPAGKQETPGACELNHTGGSIGEESTPNANSSTSSANNINNQSSQSRPLRNLISYLEQKDAAGVISLNANDGEHGLATSASATTGVPEGNTKLLYVFPPCDFALKLIKQKALNLEPDSTKEEYLLGVLVGSNEAKI